MYHQKVHKNAMHTTKKQNKKGYSASRVLFLSHQILQDLLIVDSSAAKHPALRMKQALLSSFKAPLQIIHLIHLKLKLPLPPAFEMPNSHPGLFSYSKSKETNSKGILPSFKMKL